MDAAIAGLIGAIIGALAGMAGTLISHYLQSKSEREKWIKLRREEAYANSLRQLLKAINMRTNLTGEGIAYINKESTGDWFNAINEAQIWLTSASIYCSSGVKSQLAALLESYSSSISEFIGSELNIGSEYESDLQDISYIKNRPLMRMPDILSKTYQEVLDIARVDLADDL